jgi:AcrR family transcriptional regulator
MHLFWEHGYAGTSHADLQRVMGGIRAPSFYAAFGSKEALFREAVARYSATEGAPMVHALATGAAARSAIERLLRAAARTFSTSGSPRGCFLVLGAVNCTPANKSVELFMRGQRDFREKVIHARLERGVVEGDVPAATDLNPLAAFYATVLNGMALQARDGASRKTLNDIVDCAMAAWDALVS